MMFILIQSNLILVRRALGLCNVVHTAPELSPLQRERPAAHEARENVPDPLAHGMARVSQPAVVREHLASLRAHESIPGGIGRRLEARAAACERVRWRE